MKYCIYANKSVTLQKFYTVFMKKTVLFLLTLVLLPTFVWAIPPFPGLDLNEPARPRIPSAANTRRNTPAQHAPEINLAPNVLLILVEFADQEFAANNTYQAFDSLANGDYYTYNGATGSCKQYFTDQSNGKYVPNFDVVGPVKLPQTMAYYGSDLTSGGGDDRYVFDFVLDACLAADQSGTDFAKYDNNNDGFVDFVYIIYAGFGQADGGAATTIWPHAWDLKSTLYFGYHNQDTYFANSVTDYYLPQFDGKTLNNYACSNELKYTTNSRSGIGTICHEFSHVLGLPDYYLTTASPVVQQRETPGAWSLMGYGNYLNDGNTPPNYSVYDKYYLGWIEPEALSKTQTLEIPADGATTYMLARNEKHVAEGAYRTDTVYYMENRQQVGWDAYLPGHGMLIWRVIFNEEDWYQNSPNDYVARYRLISAKKVSSPYTTTTPKPEVPFPGSGNITKYAPFSHNGLENIQEVNGLITCDFITTTISSDVENIEVPLTGMWYNILGQPIDPHTYKGVAIHNNKKYLLR